jgi:tetratricopeptide (TPR) repeat protein
MTAVHGKPFSTMGRVPKIVLTALSLAIVSWFGSIAVESVWVGSTIAQVGAATTNLAEHASYVGSDVCAGCHRAEAELWRGSQHKHAMAHATNQTVLGDFSGATFTYFGVRSRFFRQGGKFLVETDGPDGNLAIFEVKYTFGVNPLQQYLIAFPDGRLQALSIAWDSRPKDKGGQRWFHLYPNEEIRHDDVLHWTKLNQNWNFMCAECHSTGVHKNYDVATDRFATTFAEISVGCESCHGQGSAHVAWARNGHSHPTMGLLVDFGERRGIFWSHDPQTRQPQRSAAPETLRKEVETCGLCHARRGTISENWIPGRWLSDTHQVPPLSPGLYDASGQMQDEVYNYGSFKQSKMFAAGVTCSDCHEPHAAMLRLPGDDTCLQCHMAEKYASPAHHHHAGANPPLACSSCHMPARTYMVVDRRHDHSFRVPRPDLSTALGTPNACNDCHTDQSAHWAAQAIEQWHGPQRKGFQTYSQAFHASWTDAADAGTLLAAVAADREAPTFARAGALGELASRLSPANVHLAVSGLSDPDPMMRIAALDMLANVPANQIWSLVAPLLSDESRGVRIRAVELLAAVPDNMQPPSDRQRFDVAAAEFIAAQRLNADRPESRSTLAGFYVRRNQPANAETEYLAALRLSDQFTPAAINLADLYRQLGRDGEGEKILRTAIAKSPQDGGLHFALGLTLVRLQRLVDALGELRLAAELDSDRAHYAYVYGVALHSSGRTAEALAALEQNIARHPNDRETLIALVNFHREAGDIEAALGYAERLALISPSDQLPPDLIEELRKRR